VFGGRGQRRTCFKDHLETALGELQNNGIRSSFRAVILRQLLAQTRDVHADHAFLARIIGRRLAEGIDANGVFVQIVCFSGQ
jgi:hypothetical protein